MVQSLYEWIEARKNANEPTSMDDLLQTTVRYIDAHLRERLSVDDLARLTSRSRSSSRMTGSFDRKNTRMARSWPAVTTKSPK